MLIEETTSAERLFLWRHRQSVPRRVAAEALGVNVKTYADWETGRVEITPEDAASQVLVDHVLPREHYLLLRRRAGLSREDVGVAIGFDKRMVSQMEHGKASLKPLRKFWRQS